MKAKTTFGKRILSMALTFLLVLSCIPLSIFTSVEVDAATGYGDYGIQIKCDSLYCGHCDRAQMPIQKISINTITLSGTTLTVSFDYYFKHSSCSSIKNTKVQEWRYFSCTEEYSGKPEYGSPSKTGFLLYRNAGHITEWTFNNNTHSGTCTLCNKTITENCSGGTATCTTKATCSICNNQYGTVNANNHSYGAWSQTDIDGVKKHTRTCSRDASHIETISCSGGMDTCTKGAVCDTCGNEYGSALGHNYVDGICVNCGLTENGDFNISTAEQLMLFANYVNIGNKDANATLMADIDLSGYDWKTICETGLYYNAYGEDLGYSGTFDGNGYVIKNVKVKSSTTMDASCGLFGTVSGTIKNLGIENFTFVDGGKDIRAGAIVGQLITTTGKVSNCYVKNATINPGEHVTGGIAGCVYDGSIENCYVVNSTITGTSSRYGYIVGDSRGDVSETDRPGTVTNCYTDNATVYSGRTGNITNCETKTAEQFASGEVAYLLNNSVTDGTQTFYQTCGEGTPSFSGETVYYGYITCLDSATKVYTNLSTAADTKPNHTESTAANCVDVAFCSVCNSGYGSVNAENHTGEIEYVDLEDGTHIQRWNCCEVNASEAEAHNFEYSASGNTLTAKCETCGYESSLTLNAPENLVYSSSEKYAAVSGEIQGVATPEITYMQNGEVVSAPRSAGVYTASISVGGVSVEIQFEIAKKELTIVSVGVENAPYDTTTNRNVTDITLDGIQGSDDVQVNCTDATAQTPSALAGDYTSVTGLTGVIFEGNDIANYIIPEFDENTEFSANYSITKFNVGITPDNQTIEETTTELAQDKYTLDTELPEGHTLSGVALSIGDNDSINADVTNAVVTNADGDDVTGSFSFETYSGKVYYYCIYKEDGFCKYCDSYEPATLNENGYYEIDNAGKLYWFAQQVNNGETAINAVLTDNIVVNENVLAEDGTLNDGEFRTWTSMDSYEGTFDGQSYTISGLYSSQEAGLTYKLQSSGVFKNLGVIDSYFACYSFAGAFACWNYGIVENCYNASTVTATYFAGGIIGRNYGIIDNCYNSGTISGTYHIGGISGASDDVVEHNDIIGPDGEMIPGEPTVVSEAFVTDSFNVGTIKGDTNVNGIVGSNAATIENCYYLAETEDGNGGKTAEQFASGEVAYLLSNGVTDGTQVWYQNVEGTETDAYPSFEGATVYYTEIFPFPAYTNVNYQIIVDSNEYFPASDYTGESIVEGLKSVGFGYSFADRQAVAVANGITNYTGSVSQNTTILNLLKAGTLKRPGTVERICDGNGEPLTGWVIVGGVDYYFELPGIIKTGWTVIDATGVRCYFDENGQLVKNTWMADGSNWRYLGEDGAVVTNSLVETDGDTYYVGADGFRVGGWNSVEGTWYYFDAASEYKATKQSLNIGEDFFGIMHTNMAGATDMVVSLSDDTTSQYYGETSIRTFNNDYDQNWRFVLQEDGSYKIISMYDNNCLDAKDGEDYYGVNVRTRPDSGDVAQRWIFLEYAEGVYYIIPVCAIDEADDLYCALDVNYAETAENTRVSLSLFNGDPNQQFTIEPHTDLHLYDDNGFCFCDAYEPAKYVQGTDEFENEVYYFEIENAGQLFWFAEKWNDGTIYDYTGEYGFESVRLVSDIELNPGYVFNADGTFTGGESPREWTPIKNYEWRFFDGQNHTISGLYVNQPETDYVGLFATSYYYDIKNLTLTNGYVSGKNYVGSFMGSGDSPINNCMSDVTVVATGSIVGGLAGYSGDVYNSINYGTVTGGDYVGGISGDTYSGSVYNCINKGNVTSSGNAAGIIDGSNATVYNSYSIGTITAPYVYGITGGTNENSYYLADAETEDGGKTAEQFASGEVAYLLNANDDSEEDVWFQTCGEGTPSFSGETVYQVEHHYCNVENGFYYDYSNTNEAIYDEHIYVADCAEICDVCGLTHETDVEHTYDNVCDTNCNVCDEVREVPDHVYDNTCDTDCNECGNVREITHTYTNACDTDCNVCDNTREVPDHVYDNACDIDCNECGNVREVPDHVYDNACDTNCNVCDEVREVPDHVYKNGFCTECDAYEEATLNDDGYYEIDNAGKLYWFAEHVNAGNTTANAKLTADIVVNENVRAEDGSLNAGEYREWTSINEYYGTFNGQDYTISGLYNGNMAGLFGSSYGVIEYVGLVDSYFDNSYSSYQGALCCINYGTISDCYTKATVIAVGYYAGVCGWNLGVIENCYDLSNNRFGVCGRNSGEEFRGIGEIRNCYSIVQICNNDKNDGLMIVDGIVENCYYFADSETDDIDGTTAKTADQFASGEVTYLLNANDDNEEDVWFQTCGEGTPSFSGKTVYYGYISCSESAVKEYTNLSTAADEKPAHTEGTAANCVSGAICGVCGKEYTEIGTQHFTDENKVCTLCGKTVYNVSADISYGIEFEGNGYAVKNQDYTATLTLMDSFVVLYDDEFDYVIKVNGEAITEYSVVNGVLTIPAEYVTGDISIGNTGVLDRIDYQNCFHFFTGNRTPHTVELDFVKAKSTITAPCAVCGVELSKSIPITELSRVDDGIYSDVTYICTLNDIVETTTVRYENGYNADGDFYELAKSVDGCYEIDSVGNLYWFAAYVNAGNSKANAVLTSDITVNENVLDENGDLNGDGSSFKEWIPIGTYYGIFNGNGYEIKGLYLDSQDNAAFILQLGEISSEFNASGVDCAGVVENLGIVDSYIFSAACAGGICRYNYGSKINNCYYSGVVMGDSYVGGICSDSSCMYLIDFDDYDGGVSIVGEIKSEITNCYYFGKLSGNEYRKGICGSTYDVVIENCYYLADAETEDGGKTAEQFASGEVTYLMNNGVTNGTQTWYQTCGEGTPSFSGETVYQVDVYSTCDASDEPTKGYSNVDEAIIPEHTFVSDCDTICNECDYVRETSVAHTFDNACDVDCNYCGIVREVPDHIYENGFCTECNTYEEATLNDDGYYEIDNAGQFYWFAEYVNAGNLSTNAVLTADIVVNENVLDENGDLNGDGTDLRHWTPVKSGYTGTFDGQDYTIGGIYMNRSDQNVALFAGLGTLGTIKNLGLVDSYIKSTNSNVAGICGSNYAGYIENCYNAATIVGGSYVGGICGYNSGCVQYCYNVATIVGTSDVGGICGKNYPYMIMVNNSMYTVYPYINNCYNVGSVNGLSSIVGNNHSGTFTNCYYLADSETDAFNGTTAMTAEQFASGEVAYLLNSGVTDGTQAFYQTCGEGTPSFSGETVYGGYEKCSDAEMVYANTELSVEPIAHTYENGICTECGDWEFELGDVNCDGEVTISDATAIQKHLARIETLSDVSQMVADVNGDGKISIRDVTYIQMFVVKMIEEFPANGDKITINN